MRPSHAIAYGRTFQDCYDDVLLSLGAIFDPVLLAERRASMKRTFNMVQTQKSSTLHVLDLYTVGSMYLSCTQCLQGTTFVLYTHNQVPSMYFDVHTMTF